MYIKQIFPPNIFLVCKKVPGRMGLLVTLYLIASNVYSNLKAPSTRGFSYIETWMLGTQAVIIFAILEYGILLAWKKYFPETKKLEAPISPKRSGRGENNAKNGNVPNSKQAWMNGAYSMPQGQKMKIADLIALFFSMSCFICFNVHYWMVAAKESLAI